MFSASRHLCPYIATMVCPFHALSLAFYVGHSPLQEYHSCASPYSISNLDSTHHEGNNGRHAIIPAVGRWFLHHRSVTSGRQSMLSIHRSYYNHGLPSNIYAYVHDSVSYTHL